MTPNTAKEAKDATRTILVALYAMAALIVVLGLLLFYSVSRETDAVSALKHQSDRTECRSNISTDTYQRYWVDVAKALDGATTKNPTKVIAATADMNRIPLIKQKVAKSCPPPISGTSATGGA